MALGRLWSLALGFLSAVIWGEDEKYAPTFGPKARFVYFGALPKELRLAIWAHATPLAYIYMPAPDITTRRSVPSVLHACRESRDEFLYQRDVTKNHPTYMLVPYNRPGGQRNWIYFSPEQDALWMYHTKCPRRTGLEYSMPQRIDTVFICYKDLPIILPRILSPIPVDVHLFLHAYSTFRLVAIWIPPEDLFTPRADHVFRQYFRIFCDYMSADAPYPERLPPHIIWVSSLENEFLNGFENGSKMCLDYGKGRRGLQS
ncbi:hypothetical protein HYFRA_00002086 [Hymenoscyphus fraxineus]|uniref:2EXR domain-containing protein n=1 Tax=Hymenoscyphus fraxineus TaxID=746836 RepID=A0A9N9KLN4_9HELO|nr:hypothetical protein HYFRA_00002086 [Hymenoscyphus fraxineus]